MVYDPSDNTVYFVTNSTETVTTSVPLAGPASMALFSPDGTTAYVPVQNCSDYRRPPRRRSGRQYCQSEPSRPPTPFRQPAVPRSVPAGNTLLVFADNSDSVFLINLTATTPTAVEIPGFSRPVNAFFSSDSNTAYVLNCGWECGDPLRPGLGGAAQHSFADHQGHRAGRRRQCGSAERHHSVRGRDVRSPRAQPSIR